MRLRVLLLLSAAACSAAPDHSLAQHEVTAAGELLNADGRLREPGWSRQELQHWDPSLVHDPSRLRQWDFFTVASATAAVNLTLTDLGFVQLCSVGVVDYTTGAMHQAMLFKGSTADQFTLSADLQGSASLIAGGAAAPAMSFTSNGDGTQVSFDIPSSILGEAAQGSFTIHRRPAMQYLSLATPFDEDPHFFFYEQKLPGMSADGMLTLGSGAWSFTADSSTAVMDWGRGEWPSTAMWRWAGASGSVNGQTVAFNLGNGFGDDHGGTENLIVVADVATKLGRVDWTHDAADPLQDWSFQSSDGSVSLTLHPLAKETGGLDFGSKFSHLEKGYGTFSGTITLDGGTTLTIDNLPGFAEEESLAW